MTNKKNRKEKLKNAKLSSKEIASSRFEDLEEEDMKKVQGQGDVKPEKRGIWDIFTSEGKYNCR